MTPEEHLLAAAEDMAEHGQTKGSYFRSSLDWQTTSTCAIGSLARTGDLVEIREYSIGISVWTREDLTLETPAARKLATHIRAKFPGMFPGHASDFEVITGYNDADTTTAEDMILAFKEAAHG